MEKQYCPYCMTPVEPDTACPTCGLTYGAYSPAAHHLPPGTVLKERYIVGRVLGEGGFGITYIGCDMRLELRVAIKEYFPTDKANRVSSASLSVSSYFGAAGERYEEGKTRFLQEARTMARMDKQPVIVSVRDFFEANNTAYIVMEYIDGTTFKDLVEQRGGRIPAGELLYTIEPLFYALSAMHEQGLIHRDISPENLMLENGEIRLLDFGCAREAQSGDATLTIALKHGYAPVEQYQNKGQGPWTDVYALSATIYYCLTGRKPPQSMDRLVEDELILPRKLGVDLTEQQEKALLFGMGVRPRRRYQSVQELHTALYEGVELGGKQIADNKRETDVSRNDQDVQSDDNSKVSGHSITKSYKTEETVLEDKRTFGGWVRKNRVLTGGIAALLVGGVILGIVLSQRASIPVSVPEIEPTVTATAAPTVTPTPRPTHVPTPDPTPEPFANAAHLPEDGTLNEQVFRAFMNSEQIEAVVVPSGSVLNLENGALEVTKPLLIEEGACICDLQPITVSGDGMIRIEGTLVLEGPLHIMDEGSVTVAQTGSLNGTAAVWMEREGALSAEEGAGCSMYGIEYGSEGSSERFIVLNEEALFADATHVSSVGEYRLACLDQETKAIVIDADLKLGSITHRIPVMISEGVTVESFSGRGWCTAGTVFINRGTLTGSMEASEGFTVINYGTIDGQVEMMSTGAFINLGDMTLSNCQMLYANVYNLGTMTVSNSSYLDVLCSTFYNGGEIRVDGEDEQENVFRTSNGVIFTNVGVMRFGKGGTLSNSAYFRNAGQLLFTDPESRLNNGGYLCSMSASSVLDMHEDAVWNDAGFIQYGLDNTVNLSNNKEEGGGSQLAFRWGDTAQKAVRYVKNIGSELITALADDSCELVVVLDSKIEVVGDLTISKGVALNSESQLTIVGGDLTVAGENAFMVCDGNLNLGGGALKIEDGASVILDQLSKCGGISLGDSSASGPSWLVSRGSSEIIQGATVELGDGSIHGHLLNLGYFAMKQGTLEINGGVFRSTNSLYLRGCHVEIGKDGELFSDDSYVSIDSASEVVNQGDIGLNGPDKSLVYADITNKGRISFGNIWYSGNLVNSGKGYMYDETWVGGTVNNSGTIWADHNSNMKAEWSGKDPIFVDEVFNEME